MLQLKLFTPPSTCVHLHRWLVLALVLAYISANGIEYRLVSASNNSPCLRTDPKATKKTPRFLHCIDIRKAEGRTRMQGASCFYFSSRPKICPSLATDRTPKFPRARQRIASAHSRNGWYQPPNRCYKCSRSRCKLRQI